MLVLHKWHILSWLVLSSSLTRMAGNLCDCLHCQLIVVIALCFVFCSLTFRDASFFHHSSNVAMYELGDTPERGREEVCVS